MNNKIANLILFVIGAAIGSIVTGQLVKQKYEQIVQNEIASVKEAFSKREPAENSNLRIKADQAKIKPDVTEYAARLQSKGYTNYSNMDDKSKEGNTMITDKPYVISPEEFGENDDYEKISLTYYADRVLTDENDDVIEDIDDVVGSDSLNCFGEYEEDSVFVRNDRLKCDYEILFDQRAYADVIRFVANDYRKPHEVID